MPRMTESPTRFRFTQKALEALPPHDPESPSAQLELCDAECVGLRFNGTVAAVAGLAKRSIADAFRRMFPQASVDGLVETSVAKDWAEAK